MIDGANKRISTFSSKITALRSVQIYTSLVQHKEKPTEKR
jgi:hypothetical protein